MSVVEIDNYHDDKMIVNGKIYLVWKITCSSCGETKEVAYTSKQIATNWFESFGYQRNIHNKYECSDCRKTLVKLEAD